MSKSNTLENDYLRLYFNAVGIADIADNDQTGPSATLYVSLYTADPTEAASVANEAAYTGYVRQGVARDATGWTVTGSSVSPFANIEFPVCTAVPGAALTHFGVSRVIGGAPDWIGTITPNIAMAVGVVPRITTGSTITED